jgi:hypothetical protein
MRLYCGEYRVYEDFHTEFDLIKKRSEATARLNYFYSGTCSMSIICSHAAALLSEYGIEGEKNS